LRKIVFLFCFLVLSIATKISFAQNDEMRLVSPIGAAVRSAFLPGWGQIYTESKIRGSILFVSCGAILAGGFISRKSYQSFYRDYTDVASKALKNPQDKDLKEREEPLYDKANQRFKLSQFLFFSSIGVWAYGIIDSYINGNFYNAQAKSKKLLDDTKKIENMEFQLDVKSEQINLILTKNF
jgi:TM2 domain-containing membrane protein YozV